MNQAAGSAIISKIHALYGKRVKKEQFDDLINCQNVTEIASYLKSAPTIYKDSLQNITETKIHRGELEALLRQIVFENYTKIYHYINATEENIFHYIILELELSQVLDMVRLLKANAPDKYILRLPGYLVSKTDIDLMELAHVKTFDDLLRVMKKSHFGDILSRFKPTDQQPEINYVACEHALLEYHFKKTLQMFNKNMHGCEKQALHRLFSLRLDLINIQNIYRLKVLPNNYYNNDPKIASQIVFPFYHILKRADIEEMIYAPKEQFLKNLENCLSRFCPDHTLHQFADISSASFSIENFAEHILNRIFTKQLHISTSSAVVFYAYYLLTKTELSNIFHIIEGVRYNVSKEQIRNLLVF